MQRLEVSGAVRPLHSVHKMLIKQEPNTLELWNKQHFEEEKTESIYQCLKYSVPLFVE